MIYDPRDLAHIGCGCNEDTAQRCNHNKDGYCSRAEFFIASALNAARAEGMREAAGIAAKFANGSTEWSRHATAIEAAILSAIGGQK